MKPLYRVIVRTTGSVQPHPQPTFWNNEVVYCGYDRDEARRVAAENSPLDYWCGYGNRGRETVRQKSH